ncbi:hypothetical protein ACFFJ3_18760 [Serratia aquatilis]|uniref:Uncharacterized protein n=1 Tax=Serratia aquatilis TaxID=1737515 RepID=A0ABV6EHN0_9GAMM
MPIQHAIWRLGENAQRERSGERTRFLWQSEYGLYTRHTSSCMGVGFVRSHQSHS